MKAFTLIRAKSLAEASREAAKPDSEVKAGGVDLLDRMKEGIDSPARVVSRIWVRVVGTLPFGRSSGNLIRALFGRTSARGRTRHAAHQTSE